MVAHWTDRDEDGSDRCPFSNCSVGRSLSRSMTVNSQSGRPAPAIGAHRRWVNMVRLTTDEVDLPHGGVLVGR